MAKRKTTKKKSAKKKTTRKKVTKKKGKKQSKAAPKKKTVAKKKATTHTKPTKKKVTKTPRAKKDKIDSMELFFKLIHSVQVQKKDASLAIEDQSLRPIIINILKDSNVDYQENNFNGKTLIRLIPNDHSFEDDIDLEEIDKDFIFDITSL